MGFEAAFDRVHMELTADGYTLRETSPSGSRYYHHATGGECRVADHPANAPTRQWMDRVNRYMLGGCREIRVDLPPYAPKPVDSNGRTPKAAPIDVSPLALPTPEPGVLRGVSDLIYHAWPACSNSRLNDLATSPELCRWAMDHPKAPSDEMVLGTATHTKLLEPSRFDREFVEPKPCCSILKTSGAKCGAKTATPFGAEDDPVWLCGKHSKDRDDALTLDTLSELQRGKLDVMTCNTLAHPRASQVLKAATDREMSIVFPQLDGKLICKSRVDAYIPKSGGILGDIKTCRDASSNGFGRKFYDMGYHRQLAMYRRALRWAGMDVAYALVIAIQNVEPFLVRVYRINDEILDAGDRELDPLMIDFERRQRVDDWSGDDGRSIELELPAWAWKRIEQTAH